MPYLSDLLDNRVEDYADAMVGRLVDVAVLPKYGEYVPLKYLVCENKNKRIFIPYELVENFTKNDISLKKVKANIPLIETVNEELLFLKTDVLDRQIVDIAGARVVRANDIRIGDFQGFMSILGIDISFKGILRRLNMEWLDFFNLMHVDLFDWRAARLVHGKLKFDVSMQDLNKLHPADLAQIIEDLNVKQGADLVKSMDAESAANAMNELDPHVKKTLTNYLDPQIFLNIIQKMPSDEIVDILKDMPEEQAKIVLEKIKDGKTKKIEKLINYPNDKAGGIMSVDYFTALIDDTVAQTVEKIKKVSPSLRSLIYGYVVDEENKFYGIVSMRTLLISPPDYKIKKVFSHIPKRSTLDPHDDLTKIVNIMTKYDLYTVAVVDENKKLLGIIFIDDVMRRLVPHA